MVAFIIVTWSDFSLALVNCPLMTRPIPNWRYLSSQVSFLKRWTLMTDAFLAFWMCLDSVTLRLYTYVARFILCYISKLSHGQSSIIERLLLQFVSGRVPGTDARNSEPGLLLQQQQQFIYFHSGRHFNPNPGEISGAFGRLRDGRTPSECGRE